ncbi:MAG: hypothetical protein LUG98_09470, partial [Tannerellaceae bacterium]|nr:hypothetical protein [Tannerellaceae bacterium]
MMKYSSLCICLFLLVTTLSAQKGTYREVEVRRNNKDKEWVTYPAKTIDRLPGFKKGKEPAVSAYGGWKAWQKEATGFFRTEKVDGRWWIIDPQGYPFIHKAVVAVNPGKSPKQREVFTEKYGSRENWIKEETALLKKYGFNGAGAWTDTEVLKLMDQPLVYTVIISPMGAYRQQHLKKFGGKYQQAGWQGYRFDLAMVFDDEFDQFVKEAIAPIVRYKEDPYLLGYFTDNELPWHNDALDRHLNYLAKDEQGYIAAKKWLDERKGFDASPADVTEEDRMAFIGFYFDTYMRKVTTALREADPTHLYLGC